MPQYDPGNGAPEGPAVKPHAFRCWGKSVAKDLYPCAGTYARSGTPKRKGDGDWAVDSSNEHKEDAVMGWNMLNRCGEVYAWHTTTYINGLTEIRVNGAHSKME